MPLSPALLLQHLNPEEKILVAVSGGLDSVVLLHALIKAGISVGVAHVNFGLRGEESDADEVFVQGLAEHYGVPFFRTRFQTKEYADKHGISTQMAARELRYNWFEEIRQAENFDLIATAHHLNDNLETTLLNFVRGTGPAGMAGMKSRSGNLVRPLLNFTREEIEAYALENQLSWREDSSNASDAYKRNFLRHRVIPLLQELNPNLLHTFQETSQRFSEATDLLQDQTRKVGLEQGKPGFWRIYKGKLPETATALVLHEVIRLFGFSYRQADEIATALSGISGKRFFSASHQLVIDREELLISEIVTAANLPEISIPLDQTSATVGGKTFSFEIKPAEDYEFPAGPNAAAFDQNKLEFPLTIRKWETGDRFQPLGMKGKKKVSDLLIDRKVPVPEKGNVLVLLSGNEIVWVIGYQISELFKVTATTRQVLEISVPDTNPG